MSARLLAVALALLFVRPAPAKGQPPSSASDGTRPTEIVVVGSAEALGHLRALLSHRSASARVKTGAGPITWSRAEEPDVASLMQVGPSAAVRCVVDVRDRRLAHLYVAASGGERFLIREVALAGADELDWPALAEVIDLSVEALVENRRAGLSRDEAQRLLAPQPSVVIVAPQPSPVVAPPLAPAAMTLRPALALFYAAEAQAPGAPLAHGPGAALTLALSGEGRAPVALWLSGQLRLPETADAAAAGVRLLTIAARTGLDLRGRRLAVRAGAGLDLIDVAPVAHDPAVALGAAHWTTAFALTAALRATAEVHQLRLTASLFADLVPSAAAYGVIQDGHFTPVFTPWRLRPGLALEIAFDRG